MKLALVHDYLVERGGAEKVLAVLHEAFPHAPIYTSVYDPASTLDAFRSADVRTSFLQKLTSKRGRYRALLPLYPLAFASFDLRDFDTIMSSASAFAKGIRKPEDARHVCYCHTPPRFVWDYQDAALRERTGTLARVALRLLRPYLRAADRRGAQSVDSFVANSRCVAERIANVYGRTATVVPPPIDCSAFGPPRRPDNFFLLVSRLVPYKRLDIAVEAFNRSGQPLVIVGAGRDRARLEALAAGPNVRFAGAVPDAELHALLARCRALIVTAEEDFGMAALEANASGRPVIAYGAGGALDSVVPDLNGLTFTEQTPEGLLDALDRFARCSFDPAALLGHARRFDTKVFVRRMRELVPAPQTTAQPAGTALALQPEEVQS